MVVTRNYDYQDGDSDLDDKKLKRELVELLVDERSSKNYDLDFVPAKKEKIVKKGKEDEEEIKPINYLRLYRFATTPEYCLLFVGVVLSCINAFALPLIIIIYGEFTTLLVERTYKGGKSSETALLHLFGGGKPLFNASDEEYRTEIYNDSTSYLILMLLTAVLQFVTATVSVDIFNYTALKQITRIREKFFKAVLSQEIGWHDKNSGDSFGSRIIDDIEKIREGISEKVCMCISLFMCFIITVVISFIYGWKLTLVCIACVPILIVTSTLVAKFQSSLTTKELQSYSNAGTVSEEVIGGIRTVLAFGGEQKECERYDSKLIPAEKAGKIKGIWTGIGEGIMRLIFYASNALAFWYGVKLILEDRDKEDKEYTPAVLMIVFFGVLVGSDNVAKMAPFIGIFAQARGAAAQIFSVIDRSTRIDPLAKGGKIVNNGLKGEVGFENISFKYPTRIDVEVLKNFSLKIKSGQTVALVGSSGCGKSTCLQLLQRFYDPLSGMVTVDGHDIKKLNINWLRSNIAVVGQEPVLFATSVLENIRYGKPDATVEEIQYAAKASSAHDFIIGLPHGYNTTVGERGALMSGGQKQRIAIARALIQNPKILLLDEATSALDSQSEKLVQDALDAVSKGRTTLIVSHRLSTIRQADRIVVMDKGKIIEDGTHGELMLLKGHYYNLNQAGSSDNVEEDDKEIDEKFDDILENDITGKEHMKEVNHFNDKRRKSSCKEENHFTSPVSYKAEEISDENLHYYTLMKTILGFAKPEFPYLVLGSFSALIAGASYPAFAILFGEVYGALSLPNPDDVLAETNILCICFVCVGIITGITIYLQNYSFNITGVRLTRRIRSILFSKMLRQEVGWFDQDANSTGALCTKLSLDAVSIQGAVGQPVGGIFQSISTIIFGMCIAFTYSWNLALVCLSAIPFVLGSVFFEAKFMAKANFTEKTLLESSSQIAMEAVGNIRTIASLRQETPVMSRYQASVEHVEKVVRKKLVFRGLIFSIGQTIPFFAYGFALYYGGILVADGEIHYENIIKVSEALIFGAMMLGQSLAFAPAFTSAFVSANRVLRIIDRKPQIKSLVVIDNIRKPSNENTVKFSNIHFAYPKRPDAQILHGFNLEVMTGKTVALVGHSGCGKSTSIQLLQRLYDPMIGNIKIDVNDIQKDLRIDDLRSKLGLVSQEPVLFERTIAENIAYGDNTRNIHIAEVIDAAKTANIHNFIMSLPQSYDTCLGSKGTQLSGGQKQRIAIARALIRNPKILLLDEATSALDAQSEQVVHAALETARCGRTCIIIAHRLTTIQNADLICVIHGGRVVEQGTHDQLMAKGGAYHKLHKTQKGDFDAPENKI